MGVTSRSTWVERWLLPGFAFKAVVIGGGYATGRELVEFFLPAGPWGGVAGMLLGMAIWSIICAATFVFAIQVGARDYRTFFRELLGQWWPVFEVAYVLAMVVILAVFAAAAGAIGQALFGWPPLAGALAFVGAIASVVTFGNAAVERLFKYVSIFLYATYAVFLALALTRFGDDIAAAFSAPASSAGWAMGGVTYASYNVIGAVAILPVLRHLTGRRDAVIAGAMCGPLAMAPAILFFVAMAAYYPQIAAEPLPSDYLLSRLEFPPFRFVFQAMIFAALLESGAGQVHAINERIAQTYVAARAKTFPRTGRLSTTLIVLCGSVFVAGQIGLVALIAEGYRFLAYLFLAVFVAPLLTLGLARVWRGRAGPREASASA